jgi:hypothetical protein
VQPVLCDDAGDVEQMVEIALREARRLDLALSTRLLAIVAGLPFGQTGSTNLLRLVAPADNPALARPGPLFAARTPYWDMALQP